MSNPAGKSWDCFGDKRALDKVAAENLKYCVAAVQASADEIYTAYSTKKAPPSSEYEAWKIAPTLESARSTNQQLAPLFTFQRERRKSIKERRAWEFKTNWGFKSTVIECKASGRWKYPITIDRIHAIIPWSGTSAVSPKPRTLQVFYQMPDGSIVQTKHLHDEWAAVHDQPIIQAVPFSPIAAVTWDEGSEVSITHALNLQLDINVGRSACTILTMTTLSKSIATRQVVGLWGISAKVKLKRTIILALALFDSEMGRFVFITKVSATLPTTRRTFVEIP